MFWKLAFASSFHTKSLYATAIFHVRSICPVHHIIFHSITRIIPGEQYQSLSFSLRHLLQVFIIVSLLGPNVFLSTLFSDTLNPLNAELNPIRHLLALVGAHHILHVNRVRVKLRSSFSVRDQV